MQRKRTYTFTKSGVMDNHIRIALMKEIKNKQKMKALKCLMLGMLTLHIMLIIFMYASYLLNGSVMRSGSPLDHIETSLAN